MTETIAAASVSSSPAPPPATAPNQPTTPVAQPSAFKTTIADGAYEALPPDQQARYGRSRGNGTDGSRWVERSELEASAGPADQAAAKPGEAPAVTADGKLKIGEYELSSDDIALLMQQKAAADLRATQIPDAYEAKLPEGLQLPEGVDFKPDLNDPSFKDFQALSKKLGLTQGDFESLYGIWVNKTVQSEKTFRDSMRSELDKLGANATARVTSLQTFFRGHVGDDLARAVTGGLFSAKQVEAMELIARKMGSQGAASFSQAHREPAGQSGRVSEEAYAEMSPGERWNYARSHDQRQFK